MNAKNSSSHGGKQVNGPAKTIRSSSREQKKRRNKRTHPKTDPYVLSLMDPCGVAGQRVPTGEVSPSSTSRLTFRASVPSLGAIATYPFSLIVHQPAAIGAIASNSLNASAALAVFDYNTGTSQWTLRAGVSSNSTSQLALQQGLIEGAGNKLRAVSSCLRSVYTGSTMNDGGSIVGFQGPLGTFPAMTGAANLLAEPFPGSIAAIGATIPTTTLGAVNSLQIQNLPRSEVLPMRGGAEVKYVPNGADDFLYTPINATSFANALCWFTLTRSWVGQLVTWGDPSQSLLVDVTCNIEWIPDLYGIYAMGHSRNNPGALNQAASLADDVKNFIAPAMPLLGSLVRGAGRFALDAAASYFSRASSQPLLQYHQGVVVEELK